MINSTICITEYNNLIISWLDNGSKMQSLSVSNFDLDISKNIYVGRIKHVVKNIKACFVEFMPDKLGFLSFNDINEGYRIVEGELLPVQVVKEASKNKEAVLTTKLSISGKYSILEYSKPNINISKKITGELRSVIRNVIDDCPYSVIVRTNAQNLDDYFAINDEIKALSSQLSNILELSKTREAHCVLYKGNAEYINFIRSTPSDKYERILTDIQSVYDELKDEGCVLYTDDYPLSKLYSLETKIEELLAKRIWLKSGANIVIDYTEAMTVIDVNSAKNLNNHDKETNVLKLNKEAAEEIGRQLKLRNISGIIIIDFINMEHEESEKELVAYLKEIIKNDSVRCDFVDITKLGLVELVRRKIKPPIYEMIK